MEVIPFPEMPLGFNRYKQSYSPEDDTIHSHCRENLKPKSWTEGKALARTLELRGSNLGLATDNPNGDILYFSQSIKRNAGMVTHPDLSFFP
jgi:hypothetical protein